MMLLIAQPMAIRAKRLPLHRALGKVSYVVAAGVLLSMILLAHNRLQDLAPERYAIQTYVLYLQISLAALFGLSYGLALRTKRTTALHARFMVCTASYGLTNMVFLVLIYLERTTRAGRLVFPIMLAVFVIFQLPALLELTNAPIWQAFAAWFAALPIT
ncbi:MAG TPA: hypothetical protein VNJ02_03555 [Vicinamibacterales bacterium]|nr:hypothetical protein [Vicinamibacterales bacterium]